MESNKILFLESFYSGSHKAFADGLIKNSKNEIELLTMPARFWKWRMKGAALYFAEKIKNPKDYALIIASDLINLSDLKVLIGKNCPPVILYFHENQLAYPLNKNEKLDYHYGLTDLTNSLSADCIIFNSNTHMETFFKELPVFLNHLPDFIPNWSIDKIKSKSHVIYPGIEDSVRLEDRQLENRKNRIPIIIWNHRWEFDKNPEVFFKVLYRINEDKIPFKLVLLGEQYNKQPAVFKKALTILKENIIHTGYIKKYSNYIKLLKMGDIVISTANQENYGIAVIEAILAGCIPILPERLSYPEIIPSEFHSDCIYNNENDLENKLKRFIKDTTLFKHRRLIDRMSGMCWSTIINKYDSLFDTIINMAGRKQVCCSPKNRTGRTKS